TAVASSTSCPARCRSSSARDAVCRPSASPRPTLRGPAGVAADAAIVEAMGQGLAEFCRPMLLDSPALDMSVFVAGGMAMVQRMRSQEVGSVGPTGQSTRSAAITTSPSPPRRRPIRSPPRLHEHEVRQLLGAGNGTGDPMARQHIALAYSDLME